MTYYELFSQYDGKKGERFSDSFESRSETIAKIDKCRADILVVGGGIHGASAAWIAALQGFSVVLLEQNDYGSVPNNTYSESLYSGINLTDFSSYNYIKEEMLAREELFYSASHLARAHDCLIPAQQHSIFARLKLKASMIILDQLAPHSRNHRRVEGGYLYSDGTFDYPRIIRETIIAARQEGASVLNHAEVIVCSHRKDSRVVIGWQDTLANKRYEFTAGVVLNCAGPDAASMGRIKPGEIAASIDYARGIHLVFSRTWEGPSVLLPEHSESLLIAPHPSGTVVATSETILQSIGENSEPSPDEINKILKRLSVELPQSGLNASTLNYSYSGLRSICKNPGQAPRISREHRWVYNSGVLSLIGGTCGAARAIAIEGIKRVVEISGAPVRMASQGLRYLPGAAPQGEGYKSDFITICRELNIPERIAQGTLSRMGALVRYILEDQSHFEIVEGKILAGELSFESCIGQAQTPEDIAQRLHLTS